MIGRLDICVNKQVYLHNNVAGECIYSTYMGIWDGILGVEWEKLEPVQGSPAFQINDPIVIQQVITCHQPSSHQ